MPRKKPAKMDTGFTLKPELHERTKERLKTLGFPADDSIVEKILEYFRIYWEGRGVLRASWERTWCNHLIHPIFSVRATQAVQELKQQASQKVHRF